MTLTKLRKAYRVLKNEGLTQFKKKLANRNRHSNYDRWIAQVEKKTGATEDKNRVPLEDLAYQPIISLLLPTFNTPLPFLEKCVQAILDQTYTNWQLCVADDKSSNLEVQKKLQALSSRYPKQIKVVFREVNGHIGAASQSALELATGEYCGLLDHDDILASNALEEVVRALNESSRPDFIYSDEDYINEHEVRTSPFFKPDFDFELLRFQNYICHFTVIRTTIIRQVGGFSIGVDGSQDHDLFLKVLEIIPESKIKHIKKILYHWRIWAGSVASGSEAKPYTFVASKKAIRRHLTRSKITAELCQKIGAWHPIAYPAQESEIFQIFWDLRSCSVAETCSVIDHFLKGQTHENWSIVAVVSEGLTQNFSTLSSVKLKFIVDNSNEHWGSLFIKSTLASSENPVWILSGNIEINGDENSASLYKKTEESSVAAVSAVTTDSNSKYLQAGYLISESGWVGARFFGDHVSSLGYFGRLAGIHTVSVIHWNGAVFKSGAFLSEILAETTAQFTKFNDTFRNRLLGQKAILSTIFNLLLSLNIRRRNLKLLVNPRVPICSRTFSDSSSTLLEPAMWNELRKTTNLAKGGMAIHWPETSVSFPDPYYHPMFSQEPHFFDLNRNLDSG